MISIKNYGLVVAVVAVVLLASCSTASVTAESDVHENMYTEFDDLVDNLFGFMDDSSSMVSGGGRRLDPTETFLKKFMDNMSPEIVENIKDLSKSVEEAAQSPMDEMTKDEALTQMADGFSVAVDILKENESLTKKPDDEHLNAEREAGERLMLDHLKTIYEEYDIAIGVLLTDDTQTEEGESAFQNILAKEMNLLRSKLINYIKTEYAEETCIPVEEWKTAFYQYRDDVRNQENAEGEEEVAAEDNPFGTVFEGHSRVRLQIISFLIYLKEEVHPAKLALAESEIFHDTYETPFALAMARLQEHGDAEYKEREIDMKAMSDAVEGLDESEKVAISKALRVVLQRSDEGAEYNDGVCVVSNPSAVDEQSVFRKAAKSLCTQIRGVKTFIVGKFVKVVKFTSMRVLKFISPGLGMVFEALPKMLRAAKDLIPTSANFAKMLITLSNEERSQYVSDLLDKFAVNFPALESMKEWIMNLMNKAFAKAESLGIGKEDGEAKQEDGETKQEDGETIKEEELVSEKEVVVNNETLPAELKEAFTQKDFFESESIFKSMYEGSANLSELLTTAIKYSVAC